MLYDQEDKKILAMLLTATFELRKVLTVTPKIVVYRQSNFTHYFFATVLDQILSIETTMLRWDELFSEDTNDIVTNVHSSEDPIGVSIYQAITNEIQMYRRKNIEILTKLILFQDVNQEDYYKHYILISEYNSIKRRISDYKDFFSIVPNNEEFAKNDIILELIENIKNISEDKCWFLNLNHKPIEISGINIRTNENNFKTILLNATPKATKHELLILGLSYQKYSEASSGIHNSINLNEIHKEHTENACKVELLVIALIINKCQVLLNLYPHNANYDLEKFIAGLSNAHLWIRPLFEDIFEYNDYVYTHDDSLGRIEDTIISTVGYRSFKVKYLVDSFPEYGDYGYYPGHFLRRIHSRKQLDEILKNNPSEVLRKLFQKHATYEQITNSLDSLMCLWWKNGYREKVLQKDSFEFSKTINMMNSQLDKEKIESLIKQKLELKES